ERWPADRSGRRASRRSTRLRSEGLDRRGRRATAANPLAHLRCHGRGARLGTAVTPVSPIIEQTAHAAPSRSERARYCVRRGSPVTASATTIATPEHGPVLRNRNFVVFFGAAVVSNSGTWMQQVA